MKYSVMEYFMQLTMCTEEIQICWYLTTCPLCLSVYCSQAILSSPFHPCGPPSRSASFSDFVPTSGFLCTLCLSPSPHGPQRLLQSCFLTEDTSRNSTLFACYINCLWFLSECFRSSLLSLTKNIGIFFSKIYEDTWKNKVWLFEASLKC